MSEPQSTPPPKHDTTTLHLDRMVGTAKTEPSDADDRANGFIAKAAAETVRENSTPVVVPKDAGALPAEPKPGVLSYGCSKGAHGLADIGRKMVQDPAVRATCGNEMPRPEDIPRFRRPSRDAIQKTLEEFFRHARYKIAEAWAPSNPFRPKSNQLPSPATTPLRTEETKVYARREASERIDKAAFIDGRSM